MGEGEWGRGSGGGEMTKEGSFREEEVDWGGGLKDTTILALIIPTF